MEFSPLHFWAMIIPVYLDSLTPSDACVAVIKPSLVQIIQIMACRLASAKPLPETMLEYS